MRAKLQRGRDYPESVDHTGTERSVLRDMICSEVATQCVSRWGTELRAVILTGSLARNEATFVREEAAWKLMGDAEFMLIFHSHAALPPAAAVLSARQGIEQRLRQEGVEGQIDVSCVHPTYLQRLPPHIFSYELRCCGHVAWGDTQILSLIPGFSASEILREDAWRLLCNRMIELLESAPDLASEHSKTRGELRYQVVKLWLDMATSLLIFAHAYAPSYRARERNLYGLAGESRDPSKWPFDLGIFAEQVSACTTLKLSEDRAQGDPPHISWDDTVRCARQLWRWELEQLARSDMQNSICDREMLFRSVRLQSPAKRLRGWIYVLRKCGWHRSWRNWPRWMRLAWRASPRYWVYAASNELFERLPVPLSAASGLAEAHPGVRELWSWLPVVRRSRNRKTAEEWQALATEITWNYHEFLERTRS
jgi:hypothetical protein